MGDYTFTVAGTPLTGVDGFGCEWHCETADGWFGGAGVRTDTQARMQQNGDRRGRAFRAGLAVTLRGTVVCPNNTAAGLAARRLSAVLVDGMFGALEGTGPDGLGTLSSQVQLNDAPLFELLSERVAAWQVTVASEDPALYGPSVFVSTTLSATVGGAGLTYPLAYPLDYGVPAGVIPGALYLPNDGTISYLPRLRVDGPVPNPIVTLSETGDWVRYGGTVPAGSWLDIDCTTRQVLLNGQVSHRQYVTWQGGWLAVPVGGGYLDWTADAADPAARLSAWGYQGAWI